MSVIVIAQAAFSESGAQAFIDWSKSPDGYVLTRAYDGFEHIETWLGEDQKTVYLYEKWASKEHHQCITQITKLMYYTSTKNFST